MNIKGITKNGPTQQQYADPVDFFPISADCAKFHAITDQRTKIELEVSGRLPTFLAGSLYRTGPGGYKVPVDGSKNECYNASHWFDGFTVVHKFDMVACQNASMKVLYSSYGQVDELLEKIRSTGRLDGFTFGQKRDPCDSLFRKFKAAFSPESLSGPHLSNVGVTFRDILPQEANQLNAAGENLSGRQLMTITTDAAHTKQFDADTLEPLGVTSQSHLHSSLSGPLSGAHASCDPETGDIFNYYLAFNGRPTYRVFRASLAGQVDILAEIPVGRYVRPAYLHSILLSPNFVILCIWPALYNLFGASIVWKRNILDAIQPFDPNATATWIVIDRRHGRGVVKMFTSPAFFCFHTVNAWEEPSTQDKDSVDIICEVVQYDNLDVLHWFYYENLVSNEKNTKAFQESLPSSISGGLARYKLANISTPDRSKLKGRDRQSNPMPAERMFIIPFPDAGDLPRINPEYALRPHRYVYSAAVRWKSSFLDGLIKTDTTSKACLVWEEDKHTPSEPIFVPTPGSGLDEDDGVVLSVVLDGTRGTSYLLCLDARNMKEIGRADVGRPVGMGFHGTHRAAHS